jgi:hypothetical protein
VLEQAADCRSGTQRSAKINKEETKSSSRKLCALESKNSQEIGRGLWSRAENPDHNSTTPKKNLTRTKSKIEPELQTIKLPGTTTIRTHRTPEKSKEEKLVARDRKINFFILIENKIIIVSRRSPPFHPHLIIKMKN